MNLICKFKGHRIQQCLLWGSFATYCLRCKRILEHQPIYLPPPLRLVSKEEFQELLNSGHFIRCTGIYLDKNMRVEYYTLPERDKVYEPL